MTVPWPQPRMGHSDSVWKCSAASLPSAGDPAWTMNIHEEQIIRHCHKPDCCSTLTHGYTELSNTDVNGISKGIDSRRGSHPRLHLLAEQQQQQKEGGRSWVIYTPGALLGARRRRQPCCLPPFSIAPMSAF